MWFQLRSPDLAEDFERLMAGDRDVVRESLDTVSEWRLTRPLDVPGQAHEAADYVVIAQNTELGRWEEQAAGLVQHLADDVGHLCASRRAARRGPRPLTQADDLGNVGLVSPRKEPLMAASPNIVLVHGAWADGSCWSDVIERLQADGYKVSAPQLPETSLADDVARVRQVLRRQSGPTILAAHSYGGQVITSLGADAENVVGLVYIAAFGLDEGESIGALLQQGPPTPAVANVDIDSEGFGWIPEDDFLGHFAADIDPVKAKVMYAVQQPLHTSTFEDVMGAPAWKSLPSWYLVAENDEVIPPDAERQFAQRMGADTIEVTSGHCAMVSHPDETYNRIVTAANAAAAHV